MQKKDLLGCDAVAGAVLSDTQYKRPGRISTALASSLSCAEDILYELRSCLIHRQSL